MAEHLSEDWIRELDLAAQSVTAPADLHLVVEQRVVDPDGTEVAYAVRIEGGHVRVRPGRAPDAHVTFTQDRATAAAIARGERSAQRAFLDGDLRVGGDLTPVLEAARQLTGLVDVFAPARTGTTW